MRPDTAPRSEPQVGRVRGEDGPVSDCQQLPSPWPSHHTSVRLGRELPALSVPRWLPAYRLWWEVSVCLDSALSPRMKAGTAVRTKAARFCP